MKFTATVVEAGGNPVANVLFADSETNPDEPSVLMFSRALDLPDSAYYFEINDQSYGRYEGLKSVRVSRKRITAQLEPSVVQEFGNEDFATVQVEIDIDDQAFQSALSTLKSIFANTQVLIVE